MPREIPLIPYDEYRRWLVRIAPPWLQGPRGKAFLEGLGEAIDWHVSLTATGVAARFAERAPEDALPWLGAERMIERYPGESEPVFRQRVLGAWDFWAWAGTERGVRNALAQLGYDSVIVPVRTYAPACWAEFDVYLYPGWKSFDGTGDELWRIISVISTIKPAHTRLNRVFYAPSRILIWNPRGLHWNQPGAVWSPLPALLYPLVWNPSGLTWNPPTVWAKTSSCAGFLPPGSFANFPGGGSWGSRSGSGGAVNSPLSLIWDPNGATWDLDVGWP